MIRKPWPIVIVSFIFFLIPLINIFFTYMFLDMNISFSLYLHSLIFVPENYGMLFNLVVPSLVAGVSIYCIKKWSYPVFLSCMLWVTFVNFRNLAPHASIETVFLTLILPMLFNLMYVSYLLLPGVRAFYYNPKLRWWESKPRYIFDAEMQIGNKGSMTEGRVANISAGGILAVMPFSMTPGAIVFINMNIRGSLVSAKARVAYRKSDGFSHGLQFIDLKPGEKKFMDKLLKDLDAEKCKQVRPVKHWSEDLRDWGMTLIKTGDGLFPMHKND